MADPATLKNLARTTGGRYDNAQDDGQLRKVFADLPRQVAQRQRQVEISPGFVALGALLAGGAMLFSLRWNRSQ